MRKKAILPAVIVLMLIVLLVRHPEEDRAPLPPAESGPGAVAVDEPLVVLTAEAGPKVGKTEGSSARADPVRQGSSEPVRVLVLGPGDLPLEGVRIHFFGLPDTRIETGVDGVAELPWDTVDGKLRARVSGIVPWTKLSLEPDRLAGRQTTLRYPDLVPLRVEIINGDTGRPISDASLSIPQQEGEPLELPRCGTGFRLSVSPLARGNRERIRLSVVLPPGFVLVRPGLVLVAGTISRFTEEVLVTIVAWPEAAVRIRVEEKDGRPVPNATVSSVLSSLALVSRNAPTDRKGETLIRGMPCIPGETILVRVVKDGRVAGSNRGRIPFSADEVLLRAVLPPTAPTTASARTTIGIGGGASGVFGGRGGRRTLDRPPTAKLYVRVFRRNGTPARDALVVIAGLGRSERGLRTGRDGAVLFTALPPGPALVSVREPGYLMGAPVAVDLENGSETRAEILEAQGAFLSIQVLTDEGLPAAFAAISVRVSGKVPYTYLVDGIQRLNIVADRDGRTVLPYVPAGKVRIQARYGSRTATVEQAPGGFLEIRLPRVR